MRNLFYLFLLAPLSPVLGQYAGGTDDGYCGFTLLSGLLSGAIAHQVSDGGSDDGWAAIARYETTLGAVGAGISSGGTGDGDCLTGIPSVNLSGMGSMAPFTGGWNDGEAQEAAWGAGLDGSVNNVLFSGHFGRGEYMNARTGLGLGAAGEAGLFAGGLGRGEHHSFSNNEILDCTYYSVWSGLVSTAWADPANWQCNELPNRYSDVIIPGTAPHFPQVTTGPVEIRNLHLMANSALHALTGMLRILGGPQ